MGTRQGRGRIPPPGDADATAVTAGEVTTGTPDCAGILPPGPAPVCQLRNTGTATSATPGRPVRPVDDDRMTKVDLDGSAGTGLRWSGLRWSGLGGLAFTALYAVHRLLQGLGPDESSVAAVTAYQVGHRAGLLASEVAVGMALLAFVVFVAPLVPAIWRAGQESLAVAVLAAGVLFLAMGFLSTAAETALVNVADRNEPAAVVALDQLQGRTPVVWTISALTASVSLAVLRTGLLWRWLGIAGLVAAPVFLLGSIFSVLGRDSEGRSSLAGVGIFVVWMLLVSAGLWGSGSGQPRRP